MNLWPMQVNQTSSGISAGIIKDLICKVAVSLALLVALPENELKAMRQKQREIISDMI